MATFPPQVDVATFAHLMRGSGIVALRNVARAVNQLYDRILAQSGLTAEEVGVLRICAAAAPAEIADLTRELEATRAMVMRTLKPLVTRGLIVRTTLPGRRRVVRFELTPAGRQALASAIVKWDAAQSTLMERLGPARWKWLESQLSTMVSLGKNK